MTTARAKQDPETRAAPRRRTSCVARLHEKVGGLIVSLQRKPGRRISDSRD